MKKIFLAFALFPSLAFAASDLQVHVNVATQEAAIACRLRDDIDTLAKLSIRRNDFLVPYADSDFTGGGLAHVNAYNASGMFDFVAVDLQATLAASGNRDLQIVEQMCGD